MSNCPAKIGDKLTEDIAVDGQVIQRELGFVPQYAFLLKNMKKNYVFFSLRNDGKFPCNKVQAVMNEVVGLFDDGGLRSALTKIIFESL
jgi:hypothetical protein